MKSSVDKFAVVLDDPHKKYFPGDHVNGSVVLVLKKEIKIRKVNLVCRGEAYVSWPVNVGTYTRYHFNREELFQVKACVYGENSDEKATPTSVLTPSSYSFSFRFTIPYKELPTSYEAKHGYIRYYMKADVLNKHGKCRIKTDDTVFTIGGYEEYDEEELAILNDEELKPNVKSVTSSPGKSCYPRNESITISAHTNQLVYHAGEVITTTVNMDNDVLLHSCVLEVTLVRVTVYCDERGFSTISERCIVSVEKNQPLQGDQHSEELHVELSIPGHAMQPTMQHGCKCIKISYHVQVQIKLNGKIVKASAISIPLIILSPTPSPSSLSPSSSPSLPRPSSSPSLRASGSSGFENDDVISDSVSRPGTLFFITASPQRNNEPLLNEPLYNNGQNQGRSNRALDNTTSCGAFHFHVKPSISYV